MSAEQKHVYVVLGMARSGTSAITKGLNALGINLGDNLYRADERNPKGFLEDVDVVYKVNRGVLHALNYPWLVTDLAKRMQQDKTLSHFKQYALQLLQKRLTHTQHWGFKDPRTVTILAFWQEVFSTLNLQEHYIIALRNPLASAYSNQKMSQGDIERGLLAWTLHLIAAIDGTQNKKRVVVAYENMLEDPRKQLARMQQALDIPIPANPDDINAYANQFIDKKLRHHVFTNADLKTHSAIAVVPFCLRVYDILQKLAQDEITFTSPEFQTEWQQIKAEFALIYPTYHYIFSLLRQNKELERQMRTMRKSIPWKLSYPLRLIDDALRAYRKKKRERRKLVGVYG